MTYKCEKDIDCPYWMACELGICKYTKCSQQNPCSPGLICEQEFCFFQQCFSTYHCPPNFDCILGRCTYSAKICFDNSHCDKFEMCIDNICSDTICYPGGFEEEDCPNADPPNNDCCPYDSKCIHDCPDPSKICEGVCSDPSENCKGVSILGRCYDPKCDDDDSCPYLYVCKNGECVPQTITIECKEFAECGENKMCNFGYCIDNICVNSLQCPPGSYCEATRCRQSVVKTCATTFNCLGKDICIDGKCVSHNFTCGKDRKCLEGYRCQENVCKPDGDSCARNSDCPEHQLCYYGNCYRPPPAEIYCYHQVQCPSEYECIGHKCIECGYAGGFERSNQRGRSPCAPNPNCYSNSDCNENESCQNGHCVFCDCDPGQTCLHGVCQTEVDCNRKKKCHHGQVCINEKCYKVCESGALCPEKHFCGFDVCLPDTPCTGVSRRHNTEECQDGFWCNTIINKCIPEIECTGISTCPVGTYSCKKFANDGPRICDPFPTCLEQDCCPDSSTNYYGYCLNICSKKSDCLSHQKCDNGFCLPDPTCDAQGGCLAIQKCHEQKCHVRCSREDDCKGLYFCDGNLEICVKKPVCKSSSQCDPGHICLNGECQIQLKCNQDKLCPDGQLICIADHCYPTCTSDNDCPSNRKCLFGICHEFECSDGCPQGWKCVQRKCHPPKCTNACIVHIN